MSQTLQSKTQNNRKKNTATQTHPTDSMLEIARLKEQVRLLTIEVKHLRKYIEEPSSSVEPTTPVNSPNNGDETSTRVESVHKRVKTPSTQKRNSKMPTRGCTCKGECSSKICGCVKRDVQCGELCKCNNVVCKNQLYKDIEQNKENLINIELGHNHVKTKEIESQHLANATHKSVFSPDVAKVDLDLNVEQLKVPSVYFGSPKQLTFESDKEEEEKEGVQDKRSNKKSMKENKNDRKSIIKRKGKSKKTNLELNSTEHTQKLKASSAEQDPEQNNKKTGKHTLLKRTFTERKVKINEKIKQVDKHTNNYIQNIMSGMASLKRGQKQTSVKKANGKDSNSGSKKKTSPAIVEDNIKIILQDEMDVQKTKNSNDNHSYSTNEDSFNDFNPMKPKHELCRTPVHGSVSRDTSDLSSSLSTPSITLIEEDHQIPEEFNQPHVNWEQYQSQLVACSKCKRKFHPLRIRKHESCCKKV